MIRTYIQLEKDRSRGHWKFKHDDKTHPPLSKLYTPEVVALMVDVTYYSEEPGERWPFDGEKFVKPVPPPTPVTDPKNDIQQQVKNLQDQAIPFLIAAVAGDEEAKEHISVINAQMTELLTPTPAPESPQAGEVK